MADRGALFYNMATCYGKLVPAPNAGCQPLITFHFVQ